MTRVPLAVYVHLPFCARKCDYCDFNSRPAGAAERARYLGALHREIDRRAETLGGTRVRTIFLGGGTPTIYDADALVTVLAHLREVFVVEPDAEITVEANPETVDAAKLSELRTGGFNRLSLGAQSFDDTELALLGRGHTAAQTEAAAAAARSAGFANLSLDLIYALPGQTLAAWEATLKRALALQIEHLSAYGLELPEGTPLAARAERGEVALPPDAEHLAMRALTGKLCAAAGLARYEISNYAQPGYECRHNLIYWRNEPWLGLGAGAWSYLEGERRANLREAGEYCAALETGAEPTEIAERPEPEAALLEAVMMGLRLTEGMRIESLEATHGDEAVTALLARARALAARGLVEVADGYLRLTPAGEPLHSEVVVRLV